MHLYDSETRLNGLTDHRSVRCSYEQQHAKKLALLKAPHTALPPKAVLKIIKTHTVKMELEVKIKIIRLSGPAVFEILKAEFPDFLKAWEFLSVGNS